MRPMEEGWGYDRWAVVVDAAQQRYGSTLRPQPGGAEGGAVPSYGSCPIEGCRCRGGEATTLGGRGEGRWFGTWAGVLNVA